MRMRARVVAMCVAGCLSLATPHVAGADQWNQETVLTFSHDVEIPGKVLPAGTYIFRLADAPPNRHLVLVLDRTRRVFAMAFTVPAMRFAATNETLITFDERTAGTPLPLKQWFYPGRRVGEEFVYPSGVK